MSILIFMNELRLQTLMDAMAAEGTQQAYQIPRVCHGSKTAIGHSPKMLPNPKMKFKSRSIVDPRPSLVRADISPPKQNLYGRGFSKP